MRAAYVRAQDRKRQVLSWGLVLILYAIAGVGLLLHGLLAPDALTDYSGPIQVRIGSPDGLDETSQVLPKLATKASQPTVKAVAAPLPPVPVPTPRSDSARAVPAPAAVPAHPATGGASTPAASPSASASAVTSNSSDRPSGGASSIAEGEGSPIGSPQGEGTVSLKGSEGGNSFQTTYESGSGKIGRSLYVPIYLYMPLPRTIGRQLYEAIHASSDGLRTAEIRKVEFRAWYEQQGEQWTLKSMPPASSRPSLWLMLKDAGYPLARAEYKNGRQLKPVVLSFQVGPPNADRPPSLVSVKVVSSSGYADLDEAVVFGFEQAAFFNDGKNLVTGTFTYRFE